MKRGTPDHPKMKCFIRKAGIGLAAGVGTLELLWHWASKYCPRGDIGRFEDEVIEEETGWSGEKGKLVECLVDSGWIDRNDYHRLIIHHWHEHCEDSVHLALVRKVQYFAVGIKPKFTKLSKDERAEVLLKWGNLPEREDQSQLCAQKPHSRAQKPLAIALALPEPSHSIGEKLSDTQSDKGTPINPTLGPMLVRNEQQPTSFEEFVIQYGKQTRKPISPGDRRDALKLWSDFPAAERWKAFRFIGQYARSVSDREVQHIKSVTSYIRAADWDAITYSPPEAQLIRPKMGDQSWIGVDQGSEFVEMMRKRIAEKKGA